MTSPKLGYHPLLATRADTGEGLHARMRKGSANTQRGARRFIDELVARARRAGATGGLTIRFDSGFWANDTITGLNRIDVRYAMAVRCSSKGINDAIAKIPDGAWEPIEYTDDGEAEVAECAYTTGTGKRAVTHRLIVRRTRLTAHLAGSQLHSIVNAIPLSWTYVVGDTGLEPMTSTV